MDKITVIIPTFNRFKYLLNAIKSVELQTYTNIELIIINDCSTQKEYYLYDFTPHKIIHLDKNTKEIFGYACAAYVRTVGMKVANGSYIAFLDDDDVWFPNKLALQINAMKSSNCKMACTEAIEGFGVYNSNKSYRIYNAESCFSIIQNIYKNKGFEFDDFPNIFTLDFIKIHNCIICSSVVVDIELLKKINYMEYKRPPGEDYNCWLQLLQYTDCIYIKEPCVYYDGKHGDGQQWN